ncbi:MAG: nucleotidyl transferase AbiEii/AbiGii toxin family protein [Planctomycetes bacterium]|nr:nucleotidyl transferase AbiEii/AbiGii toxin family protein [Planctomycetota bacterium]
MLSGHEGRFRCLSARVPSPAEARFASRRDFFNGLLGTLRSQAIDALEKNGLEIHSNQAVTSFARMSVEDGSERVMLDLVADPIPAIDPRVEVLIDGVRILVDTPHEILVNKLCTLLSRRELRDLRDVRELLRHGCDLERALADAPRKDGGFSPLMVAWILKEWPIRAMAVVDALEPEETPALERFREELVSRLLRGAVPS